MTRACRWLLIGILAGGCSASFSTFNVKTVPVGQVQVGQTMEQVTALLGPPQQVWPSITTDTGRQQVVWEYAATATSETSWVGRLRPTTRNAVSLEKAHHRTPLSDSSHLIVFTDGLVSEIATP